MLVDGTLPDDIIRSVTGSLYLGKFSFSCLLCMTRLNHPTAGTETVRGLRSYIIRI